MLLLASTSDTINVATNAAAALDVHATWVDTVPASGTITPGRTNTAITAATNAAVVAAPAAATQRNVKSLYVRNKHASVSTLCIVYHNDGTNLIKLYQETLAPGMEIQLSDQGGFTTFRT